MSDNQDDKTSQEVRYLSVLVEKLIDQNQAVLEAVSDMQKNVAKIPKLEDDMIELKSDIKIIKAAVTDTSKQVNNHEQRITRLEAKGV